MNWQQVAYYSILSRQLDWLEVNQLTPQGLVKYQFSAMGHELPQVILGLSLNHPHDAATVYYRSRPFMLASGLTPTEALCAGMAKLNSPSEGRDVGVTYNLIRRNGATVLPMSGNVGAQYTPAAGWAQAIRYYTDKLADSRWDGAIAVAMGGDGSTATNGFWAALNIVTTLSLPLLFFIEDNAFGLSVPSTYQTPGGDITKNLASFRNLEITSVDGTDPESTNKAINHIINYVRSNQKPALIRVDVPRLLGHTYIDNQAYKSEEIRQSEKERDPIDRLKQYLLSEKIINQQAWDALEESVITELGLARKQAENTPEPDSTSVTRYVFSSTDNRGIGNKAQPLTESSKVRHAAPRINMIDAIRQTLTTEMNYNETILVFGEDVGRKGGVHGATIGMQSRFGEERVFDTSLSEEGIIGRALGMSYAGLFPIPEIQFRKYADPAHEQITDIGTVRWRTYNKFSAPMVVRMPVGYGKTVGDPWHSVSGEAIYAHLIGWKIAYPSNALDATGLLRTAIRGQDPTLFLEHRALLDTADGRAPYPGDDYMLPFGKGNHVLQGDTLTIVTWGAMVHRSLTASEYFPGKVSIIDLRTISPWDEELVLEDVTRTGKIIIIHEDNLTNGFGAEIAAKIAEQAFTYLDAPIQRLTPPDIPIPYNAKLMEAVIPSVERIKTKISELLAY